MNKLRHVLAAPRLGLLVAALVLLPGLTALTQAPDGRVTVQAAEPIAAHQLKPNVSSVQRFGAPLTTNPLAPLTSPFGRASVWRTDVSAAPLARRSAYMAKQLVRQVTTLYNGVAAFNVWNYNANFYQVPGGQPRVRVIWDDCQKKGWTPGGLYGPNGQFENVPIPSNALAATGSDRTLTIFQPASDTMWDFWEAHRESDGWHACWGGRLDHVSTNVGRFDGSFGATATGLPWAGGQLGIREVKAGRIDHAIALQLFAPAQWWRFSWPAQRSDGWSSDTDAIPEGTRLRLDPSLNVDRLQLHPVAKMIAKAAQKYGFIVTDKSGAVAVVAESGTPVKQFTGVNPWESILGKTASWAVMRNFPWERMQVLPQDYGKPRK